MRQAISLAVALSVVATPVAFAATGSLTSPSLTPKPLSAEVSTGSTTSPTLNAAPNSSAATAKSTSLGEYKTVECSSDKIFSSNSCNECFVGGTVKKGERLDGLYDNWTNTSKNMLIAYKDEQKNPTMIPVSGSQWKSTPSDVTKLWKYSSDVTWIPSNGKDSYMLTAGQKIKFFESDMGAGYTLEKTNTKNGDTVGLLKFPVVYHALDASTAKEGDAQTHYECVKYTLNAPVPPKADLPPPPKKTPPKEVTEVETGPTETLLLIVAAFFIAFGLMLSLRKKS